MLRFKRQPGNDPADRAELSSARNIVFQQVIIMVYALFADKKIFIFVLIILTGFFCLFPFVLPAAAATSLPFKNGEQLHFNVRWEFAHAGRAVFTVLEPKTPEQSGMLHFRLDIQSSSFVDIFYKVRETHDSFTDSQLSRSLEYRIDSRGRHKKKRHVKFDWTTNRALLRDFDHPAVPLLIQDPCFDPLAALYKMRTFSLGPDNRVRFSVSDGKKIFEQIAYIEKKETVTVPAGTYETLLLIPELTHFGGIFKKSESPELKIWITDDCHHVPVKIESKVAVGSVVAELVDLRN